jgi:hypothetical protein
LKSELPVRLLRDSLNGESLVEVARVVTSRNHAVSPCISQSKDFSHTELPLRFLSRAVSSVMLHLASFSVVLTWTYSNTVSPPLRPAEHDVVGGFALELLYGGIAEHLYRKSSGDVILNSESPSRGDASGVGGSGSYQRVVHAGGEGFRLKAVGEPRGARAFGRSGSRDLSKTVLEPAMHPMPRAGRLGRSAVCLRTAIQSVLRE